MAESQTESVKNVTVGAVEEGADAGSQIIAPVLNDKALMALGTRLRAKFEKYKGDRVSYENQWIKNVRQILGVYDPEIETKIGNRSKAYPKLTRVKCVSMLSRLMNLLFTAGEKNYEIRPSPVPELSSEDLSGILEGIAPESTDQEIEEAIYKFAKLRAERLEREIDDQLQELGGDKSLSYVALCRKVLKSGIRYGIGVLEGPFAESVRARTWTRDLDGTLVENKMDKFRPCFDFVPVWDYYPDLSAKYFHQMEGSFRRIVMSKHELIEMANNRSETVFKDKIDEVIRRHPNGNYKSYSFETQLKEIGNQSAVSMESSNKYEIFRYIGHISADSFREAGIPVPDNVVSDDVIAHVMIVENIPIMAHLDPWSSMNEGRTVPMYHHFIFEEDDTNMLGEGLPSIVRDSQLGVCASTRMLLDNASVMRNFEVNRDMLVQDQDTMNIYTDKIWYREDGPATAHIPAIRAIELPMFLPELQNMVKMFKEFSDEETFVNAATGGDMQNGPSEPFRTAAGASMLQGMAALPFKDVVRNFDVFTESVIGSIVTFNKLFNKDMKSIKGDFTPVARGATSLMAKEVLGIQLDNLVNSLSDEEKKYVKFRDLLAARVRVRDLDAESVVVSPIEAEKIDKAEQEAIAKQQMQQEEMLRAELRKVLADAFKSVSLANKNMAQAEAQSAELVLDAMEQGINAAELSGKGEGNGKESESGIGGDKRGLVQIAQGTGDVQGGQAAQPEDIFGSGAMPSGSVGNG